MGIQLICKSKATLTTAREDFLGIISQDSSVSKSNRLQVDIFRFLFYYFEVCSINSSKMIGKFPEVLCLNCIILKFNRFICN